MKIRIYLAIATLGAFSCASQAYTVSLQANNNTPDDVQVQGSLSYEQNGNMHWQAPMPTMNKIIAQKGKNIPLDAVRKNLTTYDLEYLDFKDMNNKLLASCLSTYYPVRADAVLRFTLYKTPGKQGKYTCQRQLIKPAANGAE